MLKNSELDYNASQRPSATQENPKRRERFRAGTQSISFHQSDHLSSLVLGEAGDGASKTTLLSDFWPRPPVIVLEIQSQESDEMFCFFLSLKKDGSAARRFS